MGRFSEKSDKKFNFDYYFLDEQKQTETGTTNGRIFRECMLLPFKPVVCIFSAG